MGANGRRRSGTGGIARLESEDTSCACAFCLERGIVTAAEICDPVEPHHGDVNKFWLGGFQSLCKRCNVSPTRFVEARGFRPDIGLDGWPLDPRHPVYQAW